MMRKILFALIGGALLGIAGLIIGMNIGGNMESSFTFLGGSGYEATGYLGALIGVVLGVVLGIIAANRFYPQNNIDDH